MTAHADTTYIATWDEWEEAGNQAATWNDVADAMDLVLNASKELYAGGDSDGAYMAVNDAYYGYYDPAGFGSITAGYISETRKTEMEEQFSAAKSVAKKGGSIEDFNNEVETLKSMLHSDANALDGVPEDDPLDSSAADHSGASAGTKTSGSSGSTGTSGNSSDTLGSEGSSSSSDPSGSDSASNFPDSSVTDSSSGSAVETPTFKGNIFLYIREVFEAILALIKIQF